MKKISIPVFRNPDEDINVSIDKINCLKMKHGEYAVSENITMHCSGCDIIEECKPWQYVTGLCQDDFYGGKTEMFESRAAYYGNEWHEVIDCVSCPHYIDDYDEDHPETGCTLSCWLHSIGKHLGSWECQLPKWEKVRWHSSDEKPPEKELIIIRYHNVAGQTIGSGWYRYRTSWFIKGEGAIYESNVIEWKYGD